MSEYAIGASDVPAILGLSPWQTPAQAWARLTGLTRSEGNNATRRGQTLELGILLEYAERNQLPFYPRWKPNLRHLRRTVGPHRPGIYRGPPYSEDGSARVRHPDLAWATCRPDAYHMTEEGIQHLVEVKTARSFADWQAEDGRDILPPGYFVQVQWQMFVTGVSSTVVEAFCTMDDSRRTVLVPAKPKLQKQLLAKVSAWRDRHLWQGELPDGLTADIAGLIWPAPKEPETWLDAEDDDLEHARAYVAASEAEKAAKAAKEAARDALVARIQDATGITGVASWKATKRGRTFRCLLEEQA
jgi:hypothetical protein